jgi:hypothetical protein
MLTESTTSNNTPGTAVSIAEIADRYTSMLYGIGRRYRLTPKNATTRRNRPGWRCVKTPTASATRTAFPDGSPPQCADPPTQHSAGDIANRPPPTSSLPTSAQ